MLAAGAFFALLSPTLPVVYGFVCAAVGKSPFFGFGFALGAAGGAGSVWSLSLLSSLGSAAFTGATTALRAGARGAACSTESDERSTTRGTGSAPAVVAA